MSLYVCNGNKCETNVNCAIKYPRIGKCHLVEDINYATIPIIKHYEIIEVNTIFDVSKQMASALGIQEEDLMENLGFGSTTDLENFYKYCETRGYSARNILARKLNDIAIDHYWFIRFTPKRYLKERGAE